MTAFIPEQAQLSAGKGGAENECDYNKKSCHSTPKLQVCTNMFAIIVPGLVTVVSIIANIIAMVFCAKHIIYQRRRQNDRDPPHNEREEDNHEPGDDDRLDLQAHEQLHGPIDDEHAPGGENEQ